MVGVRLVVYMCSVILMENPAHKKIVKKMHFFSISQLLPLFFIRFTKNKKDGSSKHGFAFQTLYHPRIEKVFILPSSCR